MKYRTKSADVLNEADRAEDILNWQLFCAEQEMMHWGDPEGWHPGEPLFVHPGFITDAYDAVVDGEVPDGYVGHYSRPMIEEFDDISRMNGEPRFNIRCEDCEVIWYGDTPCWSCGKEDELGKPREDYGLAWSHDYDWISSVGHGVDRDIVRLMQAQLERYYYSVIDEAENRLVHAYAALDTEFITPRIWPTRVSISRALIVPEEMLEPDVTREIEPPDMSARRISVSLAIQNAVNRIRRPDQIPINEQRRR